MNDAVILQTIQDYIDEYLPAPQANWSKCEFDICCHARWAAYEIVERIIEEASKLPPHITGQESKSHIEIIEEFMMEMDYYSEVSENKHSRLIFSIAKSIASEILALFI